MTFVELVVVMGILSLLAGLAIPGFVSWLPKYRMNSAADEVLSTLQQAKLRAVRENSIVSVTFDFASESCSAFLDNGAGASGGNGIQDAGEPTVIGGLMPAGIDLQDAGIGNLIRFNRRGYPDVSGDVDISNGTRSRTVSLTLGGSSSIQ
jgi:type IV fimbrial biogenesis protein FimT